MPKLTLERVKGHFLVKGLISAAAQYLENIGYTEHGLRHCTTVSREAKKILEVLKYPPPQPELAAIAGYLHDLGNVVNRVDHGQSGALISLRILQSLGAKAEEIGEIISAIGNHEEETGEPLNAISAALIIADKSDVHRTRVITTEQIKFDIHDRVNYAATRRCLKVEAKKREIRLELDIDVNISQVMEYFEIFLTRMMMCRRAAEFLNCKFGLVINKRRLL